MPDELPVTMATRWGCPDRKRLEGELCAETAGRSVEGGRFRVWGLGLKNSIAG